MEALQNLAAIVDRLAAEFRGRSRAELERITAEAWALFSASQGDETLRLVVTEWYARTQLTRAEQGDSPAA